MLDQYQPASKTPFKWRANEPTFSGIWILSHPPPPPPPPPKKKKTNKKTNKNKTKTTLVRVGPHLTKLSGSAHARFKPDFVT